eukprot:TRINITY_DN6722_c0_g1_i1.p1 TRINITY_DN6722_c0_g1~~TRINITY_DN6722_c0_g1_i1.p1  ORF type:complete len:599 (-),score=148.46 TRINITY_DN6722_c0_g1_i1:22-1818(-)
MIVRVQTASGTKRYTVKATDTLKSLKVQVQKDTAIDAENMPLLEQLLPSMNTRPVTGDEAALESLGLKHGALLILDVSNSAQMSATTTTKEPETKKAVSINERGEIKEDKVKTVVEEDSIDVALHKVDGWISLKDAQEGLCVRETKLDDFIAPWNIEKHEPWKSMNLGHIPFHSWSRQNKELYWTPMRLPANQKNKSSTKDLTRVVQIKSQPYRHIDSIIFEHFEVANNFIQAWVRTGVQQYGVLYGKYVEEEKIPLGIKAVVSAIYTPSNWNPFPTEEVAKVDEFAAKFGLVQVGWIWSQLGASHSKNRDKDQPLRVNELYHMARYQENHPNPWKASNTGKWGSKFVSVIALDNEEGQPHLRGFQLSNQGAQLINENVIKVSQKKPNKFIVARSNERWIYPSIEYFQTTGEESQRRTSLKVAERYLEDDVLPYFIVTCPATTPVTPDPLFTSFSFPATYTKSAEHGTEADVVSQLKAASSSADFFASLNDFHFLLWVSKFLENIDQGSLAEKLIRGVKGETALEEEVKEGLKAIFAPKVTTTTSTSTTPSASSASAPSGDVQTVMDFTGCTHHMATEALSVCGGSVADAVNYVLSAY